MPKELEALNMIETFGSGAVYGGRRLGVGEMRRMSLANRVRLAFISRDGYRNADGLKDWAGWAASNPEAADLLVEATREAHG